MRTATAVIWSIILTSSLVMTCRSHARVLYPNEPDPFCPQYGSTEIRYDLSAATQVTLEILDCYGGTVRLLVDASQPAGQHAVVWDGKDDAGDTAGTGGFSIAFAADLDSLSDPCTIFCGDDLEGPYRSRIDGRDQAVTFGVGLEAACQVELAILASDSTALVRTLVDGGLDAGVHMVEWDLRDDGGTRIQGGLYVCRLTTPAYDEQIAFWINDPLEPASFTLSLEDKYGVLRVGSPDSLTPTVVETPIGRARITFGRPLAAPELDHFWNTLELSGALAYILFRDSLVFSPDTSAVEIPCVLNTRPWEDIYGRGTAAADSVWMDPWASCFHLRHTFEGITWFSIDCDTCGQLDTLDWRCWTYVPDSSSVLPLPTMTSLHQFSDPGRALLQGISPVDPDPESGLRSACPNPVPPGTLTRIHFQNATSGWTRVLIVNQEGYLVRTMADDVLQPGNFSYAWDLRSDQGISVPDGIYHVVYDRGPDSDCVCSGDILISPDGASVYPIAGQSTEHLHLTALPNPSLANGRTRIAFEIREPRILSAAVYDSRGRMVKRLVSPRLFEGGVHSVVWDQCDEWDRAVVPGIYFATFRGGPDVSNLKIIVMR